MRKFAMFVAAAIVSAGLFAPAAAEAGCYRMGLTGYHWYGFCVGPGFIYPHRRVCRNGYCWYR
jgi:hypothetical protein